MTADRIFRILAAAGVLLIAGAGAALWAAQRRAPAFHGTTYTEVAPAPEFSLTDHDGRPVTLASFRGRPVFLFFGYTHCPDVCPMTLDRVSRAVRAAGRAAEDARVVMITVDPARDTPAVLKAYAARFGPRVVALTGDSAALARARRGYGAYVETLPAAPPPAGAHAGHAGHASDDAVPAAARERVVHSGVVYGIDRRGDLQVVITEGAKEELLRDDVRTLARM